MERFKPELNLCTPKNQKIEFDSENRISHLSDHVLVSILSHVPMKVVATTSLLSQRWRMLWTLLPRLEFDAEKVRFVNTENHFVEYPLPVIEEFRVCFDLNRSHERDTDK